MITASLLNAMIHELNVCQHLYAKLHPENADWRPSENIRSTTELLQYLAGIGTSTIEHYVNPLADRKEGMSHYIGRKNELSTLTFEEFPHAIEQEKQAIKDLMGNLTDADLSRTTYYPWSGQETSLFDALNLTLRIFSAYRHQLFLYAKMNGANINTMNNWAGIDTPAAVPAAA